MPVNGYNVGKDATFVVNTASGILALNGLTDFTAKPEYNDQKILRLDGITDHVRTPCGWSGSFTVERQDSAVDDFFARWEANYYAGVNERSGVITETIMEVDGSVSQYRYLNVLLKFDDPGDWSGDKTVKQKIAFSASQRQKV